MGNPLLRLDFGLFIINFSAKQNENPRGFEDGRDTAPAFAEDEIEKGLATDTGGDKELPNVGSVHF